MPRFMIMFSVLVVMAAVVAGAAFYIYSHNADDRPDFISAESAAWQNWQSIDIRQNQQTVQIRRGRQGWRIENFGGYPIADEVIAHWAEQWQKTQNLGVAAWGAAMVAESGLHEGDKRYVRLTIAGARGRILADWVLAAQPQVGKYLARLPRGERVYTMQMPNYFPISVAGWLPDYFTALNPDDLMATGIRIGEKNQIDLVRVDGDLASWRVANLPAGKMLRPDSQIVKLPKFWENMRIAAIQPLGGIRPAKTDRIRAQFINRAGLRITVTQAVESNIIYSHFYADAIAPGAIPAARLWNVAFANWAFVLDMDSNMLLRLDMPTVIKNEDGGKLRSSQS